MTGTRILLDAAESHHTLTREKKTTYKRKINMLLMKSSQGFNMGRVQVDMLKKKVCISVYIFRRKLPSV